MRVLHVVESFDGQAIESWLLELLRLARRDHPEIHWTFFCVIGKPGQMDAVAEGLGARVVRSAFCMADTMRFVMSLRRLLKSGRFDILHCHHDVMSALPLVASIRLPLKQRIVHVHNTSLSLPTSSALKARLMRLALREICLRADRVVGVSQEALDAMTGKAPTKLGRDEVVHCGIDPSRFERDEAKVADLRASFGFEPDAKILLFVGRMIPYKNPEFVVEMLSLLYRRDNRFAAVFVGRGPKEQEVRKLAEIRGLSDRVRVLGWRSDVPQVMHATDILVWPGVEHPKEGLGLGVVEAQAAGLPVLMSRNVPVEAVVLPALVKILPLDSGVVAWSNAVLETLKPPPLSRAVALEKIRASSFAIASSAENIIRLYQSSAPCSANLRR